MPPNPPYTYTGAREHSELPGIRIRGNLAFGRFGVDRALIAEKKAKGLKRLTLWVQPEDVDIHQMAARQPHALNRLRKKVERELRPQIETEVAAELERKTRRAMLRRSGHKSEGRRREATDRPN